MIGVAGGEQSPPVKLHTMNIFIAVTSGDRKIFIETAEAVLKNSHILRDSGHTVKVYFNFNDCQISRSRNLCSHLFLKSGADKMVFVDWDVGFDDDAMLKLVNRDKEFVVGVYPCKLQGDEKYPCIINSDNTGRPVVKDGLVQADMVPVGLGCLSRSVFEKILTSDQVRQDHIGMYNFFDLGMVYPDDNMWYGEDIVFCRRWQKAGGEMWIEPNINFTHTGLIQFKGNMHEYLLKQPQPE
jgi:hypothetical protein